MKIKPLALLTLSLSGFASLAAFAAAPNTDLNLMPYPQGSEFTARSAKG